MKRYSGMFGFPLLVESVVREIRYSSGRMEENSGAVSQAVEK